MPLTSELKDLLDHVEKIRNNHNMYSVIPTMDAEENAAEDLELIGIIHAIQRLTFHAYVMSKANHDRKIHREFERTSKCIR